MSIDDVNTERDCPPGPADWAARGTGIGDGQEECKSSAHRTILSPAKLELLDWVKWDRTKAYHERPPTCLHYSIVWKVRLNNKVIYTDTEQDLVLAPQYHWSFILRSKLRMLVQKKLSKHKKVTCDDVTVVVKNTGRSERQLARRCDQAAIDCTTVERQLVEWGELFRAGKKLIVKISFNYVVEDCNALAHPAKRTGSHGDAPMQTASLSSSRRLVIPDFCDTAVEEYSEWQMSLVKRDNLKEGVQRICDMALKDGLNQLQIYQDQDPVGSELRNLVEVVAQKVCVLLACCLPGLLLRPTYGLECPACVRHFNTKLFVHKTSHLVLIHARVREKLFAQSI